MHAKKYERTQAKTSINKLTKGHRSLHKGTNDKKLPQVKATGQTYRKYDTSGNKRDKSG